MDISKSDKALLNEYKGNLFEYLVAKSLAQHFLKEESFLKDMLPVFKEKLSFYERHLYKLDRDLFYALPRLAEETAKQILPFLSLKPEKFFLVGKVANFSDQALNEADILVLGSLNETMSISLKLTKPQSFINTKSAGVRSFFAEYFKQEERQKSFNAKLDFEFARFGENLYLLEDFGRFDQFKKWKEEGLPSLPGELMHERRDILLNYYNRVAKEFYRVLQEVKNTDEVSFTLGLRQLLGVSEAESLQVMVAYEANNLVSVNCYHPKNFSFAFSFKENFEEVSTSSFHLMSNTHLLQIRMKPMNSFFSPSMKVNCSVKVLI